MTAIVKANSVSRSERAEPISPCQHKDKCPLPNEGEAPSARSRRSRWDVSARKAATASFFPSHVKACANNDLPGLPWFLNVWERSKPTAQTRMIYTCDSYRCPSEQCQKKAAHTDFARIKVALNREDLDPSGFVFLVLTLDQNNHFHTTKKPYKDEQEAFKRLSANTRYFLRRLRLRQKARGERILVNEWVGTIEVQRNGYPHMNMIVYAPELADQLRDEHDQENFDADQDEITAFPSRRHRAQIKNPWLLKAVTETNWGTVSTAEGVKDIDALAGYIVKLGGEFGQAAGEIAKLTQAPTNARMKLRRIRAGKGFLPPQGSNESEGDWTGVMMRRKVINGRLTASPMLEPDQVKPVGDTDEEKAANFEQYAKGVRAAWNTEQEKLREEEVLVQMEASTSATRALAQQVRRKQGRHLRLIT